MIKPLSFVPNKYLPILLTDAVCCIFGLAQCLAHWCTAHDISGLVGFSK